MKIAKENIIQGGRTICWCGEILNPDNLEQMNHARSYPECWEDVIYDIPQIIETVEYHKKIKKKTIKRGDI